MNISFGQNKIYVYADFDRTLSPATTGDIFYAKDRSKIEQAKNNFDTLNSLLDRYNDISLFITTGRNNCELKRMQELYEKLGITFPKADAIITKDASEELQSSSNTSYPFTKRNIERSKKISALSKWNREEIDKATENIIRKHNLQPLTCQSTLSSEKYGQYSVFSTPERIKQNTVLLPDVGEMKLRLGFVDEISQEKYNAVKEDLIQYFNQANIKYTIKENPKDFECNKYRTLMFIPVVDRQTLTKSFDIKERFKSSDDTDMIIVAGDGLNDIEMLNPSSYTNPNGTEYRGIVIEKANEPEQELENLCRKYPQALTRIPEGALANYLSQIATEKYGKLNQ